MDKRTTKPCSLFCHDTVYLYQWRGKLEISERQTFFDNLIDPSRLIRKSQSLHLCSNTTGANTIEFEAREFTTNGQVNNNRGVNYWITAGPVAQPDAGSNTTALVGLGRRVVG